MILIEIKQIRDVTAAGERIYKILYLLGFKIARWDVSYRSTL